MSEFDQIAVADAFEQLGVPAGRIPSPSTWGDEGYDLVLDPMGVHLELLTKRYALVDGQLALKLSHRFGPSNVFEGRRRATLVVADRITEDARDILLKGNCGYLDLRGHLGLRTPWLIVIGELDLPREQAQRTNPLAGRAGREVAAELLMHPTRAVGVRELARLLHRSPSTVSEVLKTLRSAELIDGSNRVISNGLFWQLAEFWPTQRTHLMELPPPGMERATRPLRLGLDSVGEAPGWALTDLAAAAALGAPVAVRSDQVLDFFVPDGVILRRASTLLGVANGAEQARCSVRVAPVPSVCVQRVNAPKGFYEWPTAHPLFVALDLAQDRGRGREVLGDWTPFEPFVRVW